MSTAVKGTPVLEQELLSPSKVALILGVTTNTLAIWRYYRRGPDYLKIGRQIRYPAVEVEHFLHASIRECNPEIKNLGHRR